MNELLNRLQSMMSNGDVDGNQICQEYSSNPYRHLLNDVMIERKDILRGKLNMGLALEMEESSAEIERILGQLTYPKFPLSIGEQDDGDMQGLERKYFEDIEKLKNDLDSKEIGLRHDHERALEQIQMVLRGQMNYRPIDERDLINARDGINRRFEKTRQTIRGDAATKVLMLRREIEQMCRKRKNFDKQTTDILQKWFTDHCEHPYPTEQEKEDLAKMCGIKLTQVNNWFGNQRIRNKQTQKLKNEGAPSTSNSSDSVSYALPFSTFIPSSTQHYYPHQYDYDNHYLHQQQPNNQF